MVGEPVVREGRGEVSGGSRLLKGRRKWVVCEQRSKKGEGILEGLGENAKGLGMAEGMRRRKVILGSTGVVGRSCCMIGEQAVRDTKEGRERGS